MNNIRMTGLLIGSLPATALVSITYDYGFFLALGISLPEAPTSLFDHVSSWLYRFPYVAAFIAFFGALAISCYRLTEYLDEGGKVRRWLKKRGHAAGIGSFLIFGMVIIGAEIMAQDKFLSVPSAVAIGLGFISSSFAHWTMEVPLLRDRYVIELKMFRFVVPVLLFTFAAGHFLAYDHIGRPYGSHNIYTVNLSTGEDQRVEIIKLYDEWLLVRGASEELAWIAKDSVQGTVLSWRGTYRWPWQIPVTLS